MTRLATPRQWHREAVLALLDKPFNDLLHEAHSVHRKHFDPNRVQPSTLLSIKTGACPEDCKYCPQSGHYNAELEQEKLVSLDRVVAAAESARAAGATRFCMGAAWRSPSDCDLPLVADMIRAVRNTGMETCVTLGMLSDAQAEVLADAGLDYCNHNLDTSPEYYGEIITTRTFADRLDTLKSVQAAGIRVCTGGILGMDESLADRAGLLQSLANLSPQPDSVPLNLLVRVPGTPLENAEDLPPLEFIRTIAAARIMMPKSYLRLSAGRESLTDCEQALAFHAGANSIFLGERLLTTDNPNRDDDTELLGRLGIEFETLITENG